MLCRVLVWHRELVEIISELFLILILEIYFNFRASLEFDSHTIHINFDDVTLHNKILKIFQNVNN